MSELEKKGSAWPWIVVPVTAVIVFFVLRECQHRLPPAGHAPAPTTTVPAQPDAPAPAPAASPPEPATPAAQPAPR
jgi:hypothetical protein